MQCRKCGLKMDMLKKTREGNKVVARFVCPGAECQGVSIVVQPVEKTRGPGVSASIGND
jgi:hypothetical protein